ncbi:hypothetical protein [Saccharopolyspora sp. NPDC049426]|uniref:hypothetical protein n=1 Tax=Saccharopolyspora sp. NPDC049426 TaxID=3155652 RepID=UPI0034438F50
MPSVALRPRLHLPRGQRRPAFVEFDTAGSPQVVARIGISFVSADNARANAESEQGGRDFEEIRDGTRAAWNDMLGRR